jgi:hypothetical protein
MHQKRLTMDKISSSKELMNQVFAGVNDKKAFEYV